jgi:putative redox protein
MTTTVTPQLRATYDGQQHCTVAQGSNGKTLAIDCPYTGGGNEFSPGSLVGAGLAGCVLLSMGTLAQRDELDITGTAVDVDLSMIDKPERRIDAVDVTVNMPRNFSEKDRSRLERAAEACPIKHSFRHEVTISTKFVYPE